MQVSRSDTLLLFAAIAMHKIFASMSIATRFLRYGASVRQVNLPLLPYHVLPPLAVVISAAAGSENVTASLILSGLSAGTFLYIGAFEVVCEEFVEAEHEHTTDRALENSGSGEVAKGAIAGEKAVEAAPSWRPSKGVRFAAFTLGAGLLLGLTAALPEPAHNH